MNKKKTVAICTDHVLLKTGFAKFKRAILRYLYSTGKYNIIEFSNGIQPNAPELDKLPWNAFSTLPTPEESVQINSVQDDGQRGLMQRQASYGRYGVPRLLKENKVDILIAAQDSWGVDFFPSLPEVKNVTFIPHVTIDSENLLQSQIELASAVNKLYVWASFAIREYEKHGYINVEYLPGTIELDNFKPLDESYRNSLRKKFGLQDSFVAMATQRNQLRKEVPAQLDGFQLFKKQNPTSNAKFIFVTHLKEGWNIVELMEQRGIPLEDVYFTYYCKACRQYELRPFVGHDQNCPLCGAEKTFDTVSIVHGVTEESLNEIYNIADVYVACFSSGGYEIPPKLEAKAARLPVLATAYSCGEDIVKEGRGALPLEFSKYFEFQTAFVKAHTLPESIAEQMTKVFNMSREDRIKMGEDGRKFVLENLSPEVIGKKFEEIIDAAPFANWDDWKIPLKNPNYQPPPNLSPEDFVLSLFNNMLDANVDKNNKEVKFWVNHLNKTRDYQGTYNHFKNLAAQHNAALDNKPKDLADFLDPTDDKRLCIVMPQSAGDVLIINSLVKQVAELYPEFRIYFVTMPQFRPLIEGHPNIHRVLDYAPCFDDIFFLEGRGENKGYFDIALLPHGQTQKFLTYQHGDNEFRAEWLKDKTTA